ncbi:MAG: InlB B-repeat-containing protein [Candidatus Omnitrophica bacterium]|nr:InlB B-repeat-containing protein [Candidatus Omnitrophota bacterium]
MKNKRVIFMFLLIVFLFWGLASAGNQPSKVYFRADKHLVVGELLANGIYAEKEYVVKAICYQPIPIGADYDYFDRAGDADKRAIYERDFAFLESAGFNTIRTWTEVNQLLLDTAYRHKIKVCMGFSIDPKLNFPDPAVRKGIKDRFSKYVTLFKDHPAVLFWMLGNEQNYTNGDNPSWYTLANELGEIAHSLEGAYPHPVAIVEGDLGNIGNAGRSANDAVLNKIDLWASNVYRGKSFDVFFRDYKARSNKPLLISEYGIDAYDSRNRQVAEMTQMLWDRALWQEIAVNNDVCVGGTVMNYSDGWWKITPYIPSGYMGDTGHIVMDDKFPQDNPSLGSRCIKFIYNGTDWAGVYWQSPPNNWGNLGPGLDLSDFSRIRFWARGENGGEKIEFKIGGIKDTAGHLLESADKSLGVEILKKGWNEYVYNLSDQNLTDVKEGFCWVASAANNPGGCIFYLDKIRYESADGKKTFYLYVDSAYADMSKEHLGIHDDNGFFTNAFPDGRANEEWFGLVAIQKNGNGPDLIRPRLAFYNLFTYTLTVNSNVQQGIVTKTLNKPVYNSGEKVSLSALAMPGYKFIGWSGDVTGTASPITVSMDKNKTVTANFVAVTYNLTLSVQPGLTVARSLNKAAYNRGETITLTAVVASDYHFIGWSGNIGSPVNAGNKSITITMDSNKSIKASCAINTYNLGLTAFTGGSVTKSPNKTIFNSGEKVTLTAKVASGYTFSGWRRENAPAGAVYAANPLNLTIKETLTLRPLFTKSSISKNSK